MSNTKLDISVAQRIAAERGGECLSTVYVRSIAYLSWKCASGHQWEASLNKVKDSGHWCPTCAKMRVNLETLRQTALKKGGECLAVEYTNVLTKVTWRCSKNHEWEASWHQINSKKQWCPTCMASSRRLNFDTIIALAAKRGGLCLTPVEDYQNNSQRLKWQCAIGHTWDATYSNVSGLGRWCPQCANIRLGRSTPTIETMRTVATNRGGKCLSDVYTNKTTPLLWECAKGHTWHARPTNVKDNGTWCPECCRYKEEDEVRNIFERLTGKLFPKRRGLLENTRYELDGYCEEFGIAFEYQGKQHYQYVPYFHRNGPIDFERQQEIDREKVVMCVDAEIVLIEIPYNLPRKEEFIAKKLRELL